jgi:hypothetical protein
MKKWSRTLLAGSALILLTNAVVLFGVSSNRDDTPESQLKLTQRELQISTWNVGRDNSGITLRLNWRFEMTEQKNYDYGVYSGQWGLPAWLDKAKMAELGFDVDKLAVPSEHGRRHREQLSREVLLVLELDGQAYQHQLRRVREYAENERTQLEAIPNSEEHKRRTKSAEQNLLQEQNNNSRLFVIDAGLDLRKLRATYPDRSRYSIVHGLIRPNTMSSEKNEVRIGGTISDLYGGLINVPFERRHVFNNSAPYEVTVAYGKRLEPWIVAASRSVAPN